MVRSAGVPINHNAQTVLYGTSACHLCELAERLLDQYAQDIAQFDYEIVDISDSDPLFTRYGLHIPVLRSGTGKELNWPFTLEDIRLFLEA